MKKFIRKSDYASGDLTENEKRQMAELVDKWKKNAFRIEAIEEEKIIHSIKRLYKASSLKEPVVVVAPNPLVAALASGISSAWWFLKNKNIKVTEAATWNATGDATRAATRDATEDATRAATDAATRAATENATGDATEDKPNWLIDVCKCFLGENYMLGIECIKKIFNLYQGGNHWSSHHCYYEALREVLSLKDLKCWEKYSAWEECGINGCVRFMHEQFCIVSDFPLSIKINNSNQPHCVTGPSHEWRNGFRYYYINGVAIAENLFRKLEKKEYTFRDFTAEKNEETKSAVIAFMQERWGEEYLFRFLSSYMQEVDSFVDKKDKKYLNGTTGGMNVGVYTLFKGNINGIEIAYVRCYCPSTDRMFFLGVNPSVKNAKDAIASLYRCPKKLIPFIKEIRRQGERFSTTFNDNGIKLLNELTKEEVADTDGITGNLYFEKMTYEF